MENVKIALTRMACYRQAVMDRATLEAFTQALMQEDLRAFQVAMAIISETMREPGETAFHDLGYILAIIRKAEETRWRDPKRYPPADRSPLYAPSATSQPAQLTGDRLRLAILAEIEAMQKDFKANYPDAKMYDILEVLPEPQRSRYIDLTTWAADWRTYPPLKKALPRPRTYPLDKALPQLRDAGGVA
jgi:hypothetical protein